MIAQMFPALPSYSRPYSCIVQAKLSSNISECHARSEQLFCRLYQLIGQFSLWLLLPFTLICSAFIYTIPLIIRICPQEKMLRIAAPWIVAFVQTVKTFRNWAEGKHPSDTMRLFCFTITSSNRSVTLRCDATQPLPTPTKVRHMWLYWSVLVYLFPKPLLNRDRLILRPFGNKFLDCFVVPFAFHSERII